MSITSIEVAAQRALAPWYRASLKRAGVIVGRGVRLVGPPIVSVAEDSSIDIGEGSILISRAQWTALGVSRRVILRTLLPGAEISIGRDVGMSGTTICAAQSVAVGDRVLFGADSMVVDTDFHPVDSVPRKGRPIPSPAPGNGVVIGSDVFVGARSMILKGVTVGACAVIGAGSVVVRDVPAGAVFAGSPARFVRWAGVEVPSAGGEG